MPVNECWCQEPVNTDSVFWVPNGILNFCAPLKYKSSASSYHVFSTSFSCACMFLLQIWIQPEPPKQLIAIFRNLTSVRLGPTSTKIFFNLVPQKDVYLKSALGQHVSDTWMAVYNLSYLCDGEVQFAPSTNYQVVMLICYSHEVPAKCPTAWQRA